MLRNYVTVAFRNIQRNLSYSAINVFGLALGITCSLVLFLMIMFFTSFDNYHKHKDRIYRLVNLSENRGREDFGAGVPTLLPEAVKNDIIGIEHTLFISGANEGLFTVEDNGNRKIFEQENGFGYTDSTYFTFFDVNFLSGNYKTALTESNQIVLTERTAAKFFGDADPMGKLIRLDNRTDLKVSGVMQDFPENTNFPFEILISYSTIKKDKEEAGWGSIYSDDQCYVMLKAGIKPDDINSQFPSFIKKYQGEEAAKTLTRWLQPLAMLSHDTRFGNYRFNTVSRESILAMGVVAFFLIVTACINFVNLSTAVAVKRSKEVGIRKVLGSQRAQLVFQHLAETGIITLVAILLSVGLSELALIQLNSFLDINLHVDFSNASLLIFLSAVWVVVSMISGFYPALLLSGFSPAQALKNKITNRSTGGFALRRGLVVFQFVISQLLIVGTVILLSQMNFLEHKDLGFAKEAIITVPIPASAPLNNKKALKSEVERIAGVERASLCFTLPSSGSVSMTDFALEGVDDRLLTQVKRGDKDYLSLFDIELLAGNDLGGTDTATAILVNERLVKSAGYENPEDVVGRVLTIWDMKLPVAGVVKDFHTMSLTREIDPTVIFNDVSDYYELAIRLKPGSYRESIQEIEWIWTTQYSDYLFSYEFLDRQIAEFYESEQRMSVLLIVFSSIAITIGCLGLYGLVSFMANEKEKEIGVRKVLGATPIDIMYIFSKEFIVLIVVAFAIASPLAGYVMNQWLDNFAYRVPLSSTMFVTGIAITFLIAFVTVSYRSIRASLSNPVEALRNE